MNIQEIIESINYCLKCNNDSIPTTQEDLKTIKEALAKQIPQKPDYEGDGYDEDGYLIYYTWICPNCGKHYEVVYGDKISYPAFDLNAHDFDCNGLAELNESGSQWFYEIIGNIYDNRELLEAKVSK